MDLTIGIDLVVLIAGLCLYLFIQTGKGIEVGRLMFFAGLFAMLFHTSGTLHLR